MANICWKLFHLFIFFALCKSSCDDDWPPCKKGRNIVCTRKTKCTGRSGCIMMDMDETFRRWYVDGHNELRNNLATGKETRGGNGAAADMMALSFNLELEYAAACNLMYCEFKHDACRSTKKHNPAGQNLYFKAGTKVTFDTKEDVMAALKDWFEECAHTTEAQLSSFHGSGVGHFTQLVWAKTTHVGCARARRGQNYYFACNYGIAGNFVGEPTYTKGAACSKCPDGVKCNGQYTGLCGEIDESDLKKAPLKGSYLCSSYHISLGLPFVLISVKNIWFLH